MGWVLALKNFTNDFARQVQFFMICRQLGIIFSSIILAWLLPVTSVGVIEMLMLAGYLMSFFWSDALLRGFLASKHFLSDRESVTSFFLLYFLTGFVAMMILLAGQKWLIPMFTSRQQLEGLELFAFYQILVIPLWIAPFIGLLKGQNILLASIFVLLGPAFAVWTGIRSLPDIRGALLGLFCYALVGFVWVLTKTKFVRQFNLRKTLLLIWPATWPLAMYAISNGLAKGFDSWLVARNFDETVFAVFRYGAREFPLVVALSAGLSAVMIPKLLEGHSVEELKWRTTRIMHACYPLIAILILTSPVLFEWIYGPEYRAGAYVFNIYLLLTVTQLFFPQSIITARGDTKVLWHISIAELIINIAASVLLMKYFGILGIAWGTVIAFTFEKTALVYFVRRRYGIPFSMLMSVPVWLRYGALLLTAYIISIWIYGV